MFGVTVKEVVLPATTVLLIGLIVPPTDGKAVVETVGPQKVGNSAPPVNIAAQIDARVN
jgi:hypothetical protein